ncbi:MAG: isoleucine--tRNA ligase [Acidobacteriota bacterium]
MASKPKARYRDTLNLPKTDFPMRANLAQNEAKSQKRWTSEGLYAAVLEAAQRRADDEGLAPFVFHDGPPYANGDIHTGHLLNKCLKDFVVRTRNLAGRPCAFVPGWDCHGLPIEHKVLSELVEKGKMGKIQQLDEDTRRIAIRRECARYAERYTKVQAKQMQRLLTLADYDDPYLTMRPDFEGAVLEVFADLIDQELVYRALKPVHWSIANQTALAEAELEYQERVDPSVYVGFETADADAACAAFGLTAADLGGVAPRLLIWTTTPWTLPANRLIAVHETIRYALVRLDGVPVILARARLEAIQGKHGGAAEILAEADGSQLLGLTYRHPFIDAPAVVDGDGDASTVWRVVAADYVTVDDGTGLVHTAPGHGQEDYLTGLREQLAPYSPVRGDGTYDDTVPDWLRGLSVWEANDRIASRLRDSGHLLVEEAYPHSYPHDWRSKTPVIFRGTEQWFIGVDRPMPRDGQSLRARAQAATTDEIEFIPGWGRNRLHGMLESRPDWCISRQRAWGLPIPAFRLADGTIFLTAASTRAVAAAFRRDGSDAWFTSDPAALLADYDPAADPDAPATLRDDPDAVAALTKTYDIFDVWFESGSSWHAVMRERGIGYPIDLYLEGSDQHRGWFQLSLLPALGVTGQPPFKRILTHGFIVDKDNKKMSKSLGNALNVDELLKDFGADVCRWWVSSLAYENDIKVDLSYFQLAGESYRKVRNTLRFLLGNLADFEPATDAVAVDAIAPHTLDAWLLAQTADLHDRVVDAYDRCAFRQAHLALFDFCNDTLSAVYLDAVKDRLYCDRLAAPRRRRAQTAMHHAARTLISLLAPLLPHTADEAHRALRGTDAGPIQADRFHRPPAVAADDAWPAVLEAREQALKKLEDAKAAGIENTLDAGLDVPDGPGTLAPFADELVDLFGVSRVALGGDGDDGDDGGEIIVQDLRDQPRCERSRRRDETVRERGDGGLLSDRDAEAVGVA